MAIVPGYGGRIRSCWFLAGPASFDGSADDGAPVELKVPCAERFAEVAAQGTQVELH
jgi:hypothetical protein